MNEKFLGMLHDKNISQYHLAKETGMSQATISKICNNKQRGLLFENAKKISEIVGVSMDELYEVLK